MLKNIPPLLGPELVKTLMEMGHMDEILLADGNFPAHSFGSPRTKVIHMDGYGIPEILEAILRFMPLDEFDEKPVTVCSPGDGESEPPIWAEYQRIVAASEEGCRVQKGFDALEKYSFYKRCEQTFCIVSTGETALYGNIILKKGVVRP